MYKSQETTIKEIIISAQEFTLLIHCAESLKHSNVYIFYL